MNNKKKFNGSNKNRKNIANHPSLSGTIKNITENRKIAEQLKILSSRHEAILAAIPDIITETDINKVYSWVNKAGFEFFGDDIIGKEAKDYFEGEQKTYRIVEPLFSGDENVIYVESWQRRKDGEKRLLAWWCRVLKDTEGNVTGTLSTARDITEQKKIEEELRKKEAQHSLVLDSLPMAFYIAQPYGDFGGTWASEQIEIISGFPAERFIKNIHFWASRLHPEDREHVLNEFRILLKKESIAIEYRWHTADGKYIWILDHAVLIRDTDGKPKEIIGTWLNITDRKNAENEIKKYSDNLQRMVKERTKKLEKSQKALISLLEDVNESRTEMEKANENLKLVNRELNDFAYIVSHDLKAPLRGVTQLASWLLTDYTDSFDEKGKERMNMLMGRVKRMNNLIDGILQYSRVGRVHWDIMKIDLNALIYELIKSLSPEKNINITIDNKLQEIIAERTRIEQVFQNLLTNAIIFMDKAKGIIKISCKKNNSYWHFRVSDNGPGIDKKYHEKVFQIFQTLTPRDKYESTGIGLTIVKKIIELYGGRIWIESKIGKGTTFHFTLPIIGENS
jgi:PAS domain S-box-containing protein